MGERKASALGASSDRFCDVGEIVEFDESASSFFFLSFDLILDPTCVVKESVELVPVKLNKSAGIQISCKDVMFRSEYSLAANNDAINSWKENLGSRNVSNRSRTMVRMLHLSRVDYDKLDC